MIAENLRLVFIFSLNWGLKTYVTNITKLIISYSENSFKLNI